MTYIKLGDVCGCLFLLWLVNSGWPNFGDLVITGSPHTRRDPATAIALALKSSVMYSCLYVLMKRIITQLNRSWTHVCTRTVMPASIKMSNYYFHQISSFCYFNVLCCINHWWHLTIHGDPVMTWLPKFLLRSVSRTSGCRRISNTRGPQDVAESQILGDLRRSPILKY